MKKNIIFASIVLAATITFILVSCQKENSNPIPTESNNERAVFKFPKVDDMNAYLKDYKRKITETRGDEAVSLAEAEWHLSSLANYDFGYANVEYGDFRFDTVYASVNITNGEVRLSDLGTAYSDLSASIASHFDGLDLENKHIRFVDVSISDDGLVTAILGVTFLLDHQWYFDDIVDVYNCCDSLFDSESVYLAYGLGKTELQRILNLMEGRPFIYQPLGPADTRTFLVHIENHVFNWNEWIDPYESPNYCDSRLYAAVSGFNSNLNEDGVTMCYLLDSYLGLGCDYADVVKSNNNLEECYPVEWTVYYQQTLSHLTVASHQLIVKYAYPVVAK